MRRQNIGRSHHHLRGRFLEQLESRVLLSGTMEALQPLAATFPSEVNNSSVSFADLWHLYNTGQRLNTPISGPATGTPGADISAPEAWDLTRGTNSVVIAVLDTGVNLNHPDLQNNLWTNPGEVPNDLVDNDGNGFVDDYYGWDFVNNSNNIQDVSVTQHGTLVSGVIGAHGNNGLGITGVAWNVDLMTIKVGTDAGVTSQAVIDGINYVIAMKQRGVDVVAINASYISFGIPSFAEIQAIQNAGDNGILYIAAAGNGGMNLDTIGGAFLPSNMTLVAATNNRDQLWSESNYGRNTVDLGAPGVDILTTFGNASYAVISGTSFSAPMVSGAVALLASYVPSATTSQIMNAILQSVDPVPSLANTTTTGGRLNVYNALQTLLGPQPPIGSLDVANGSIVAGWAFDYNAGALPIQVQLIIDGVGYTPVTANAERPDLLNYLGSTAHGYVIQMPALGPGPHTVQIYAGDYPASPAKLIGQTVVSVASPPVGYVDLLSNTTVFGWAYDPDSPSTAITVRVDIDGQTVSQAPTTYNRPDLLGFIGSSNHGFLVDLPSMSAGFHRVDVYALDAQTGAPTLLASSTVNGNLLPFGSLDLAGNGLLAGWAYDNGLGGAPIYVRIDIDNEAPVFITANASRPDLAGYLGSANHGYVYQLPQLMTGLHTVRVYAADSENAALVLLGETQLQYIDTGGYTGPFGSLDLLNSSIAAGWIYDADAGPAPAMVRIDVDSVPGTPFAANYSRPDLAPYLGTPNHGYVADLSGLSPGVHRITVWAIDTGTSIPVLIADRWLNNETPFGWLDVANASVVAGWAYAPGVGSNAASVRIDIDDEPGVLVSANYLRPDLTGYLGSAEHGYVYALPALSAGSHKVTVSVLDPYTFTPYLLGEAAIVI